VLLAKDETEPQGVIDRLIEIGRCCGMKMNIGIWKSNRNLEATIPKTECYIKRTGECGTYHLFG
jgi:hypothetical protein